MKLNLNFFQRLGKSIMFPVTVLPLAALMLRLGAPDVSNIPVIMKAGGVIFENLALIFAIGVAVGWAFDNSGSAGLAGAVGYLIITSCTEVVFTQLNPDTKAFGLSNNILFGLISGLLAGSLYNRFYDIKMPDFLGFFGGRRFVPLITGTLGLIIGIGMGSIWNVFQQGLQSFGNAVTAAGPTGPFLFGFLNRALWPIGLHHVFNNIVWFVFGSFTNAQGAVVTGDIGRFFAGDTSAGIFTAGFYPVFLGGYAGAALAMYLLAKPEQRKAAGGLIFSTWLAAFLTGIDEPFVFLILFTAPLLYFIHAGLTALSLFIATVFGAKLSFGFSAGLLDYILAFGMGTKPLILLMMSGIYFVLYFLLFSFWIKTFNVKTPGREDEAVVSKLGTEEKSAYILGAVGGMENLNSITNCITRLRLGVKDTSKIDRAKLDAEHFNYIFLGKDGFQVILGLEAELIANIWKGQQNK